MSSENVKYLPVVEQDEWLLPVADEIERRHNEYLQIVSDIERSSGSMVDYANGYRYFGWQRDEDLAGRFIKNIQKFTGNEEGKALVAAGPQL